MSGLSTPLIVLSIIGPVLMPVAPLWLCGCLFTLVNAGSPWSRAQRFVTAFLAAYFFLFGCLGAWGNFFPGTRLPGYWVFAAMAAPCLLVAYWWSRRPQREPWVVPWIFRWVRWGWPGR
ncbi:MAG: hypothetical protein ACRD1L_10185 [Terriglobales bacterium]